MNNRHLTQDEQLSFRVPSSLIEANNLNHLLRPNIEVTFPRVRSAASGYTYCGTLNPVFHTEPLTATSGANFTDSTADTCRRITASPFFQLVVLVSGYKMIS